jgi:hypothetical protein
MTTEDCNPCEAIDFEQIAESLGEEYARTAKLIDARRMPLCSSAPLSALCVWANAPDDIRKVFGVVTVTAIDISIASDGVNDVAKNFKFAALGGAHPSTALAVRMLRYYTTVSEDVDDLVFCCHACLLYPAGRRELAITKYALTHATEDNKEHVEMRLLGPVPLMKCHRGPVVPRVGNPWGEVAV